MRGSVKAAVWIGPADCYRDQLSVLAPISPSTLADARRSACQLAGRRVYPSGQSKNMRGMYETTMRRGGSTPFNLMVANHGKGKTSGGGKGHPAATPATVSNWWIRYICPPGGTVLDPFSGLASVGRSAVELGRDYVGIERDPVYFAKSVEEFHSIGVRPDLGPAPRPRILLSA